jgi:hypothetical protein
MTWDEVIVLLRSEFPKLKIIPKSESKLMKLLALVMFWNPSFMDAFTVVFGNNVYMPQRIIGTDQGADILRHEAVHMRDSKKYHIFYALSYIILPIGPSGRAFWEFRGYKESMRAEYERYGRVFDQSIDFWVSQFTGPNYLFMFPFPKTVRKWFEKAREEITNAKT